MEETKNRRKGKKVEETKNRRVRTRNWKKLRTGEKESGRN